MKKEVSHWKMLFDDKANIYTETAVDYVKWLQYGLMLTLFTSVHCLTSFTGTPAASLKWGHAD